MKSLLCLTLMVSLAGCPSPQPSSSTRTPRAEPPLASAASGQEFLDPNCQVDVVGGGAIPHYFGAPNAGQRNDATNAIAQLAFADLYRNPPFRINGPANLVRLDVQGVIAGGGRNWQIQINGIGGATTISHMLINGAVGGASTPDRQANVQRSARNALNQSLATGNTYNVGGFCN